MKNKRIITAVMAGMMAITTILPATSTCYAFSNETEKAETTTEANYQVTTRQGITSLSIHSGPGTDYEVIGYLLPGDQIHVLSITQGWCQITYSGKTGYVYRDFLEPIESKGTATESKGTTTAGESEETTTEGKGTTTAGEGNSNQNEESTWLEEGSLLDELLDSEDEELLIMLYALMLGSIGQLDETSESDQFPEEETDAGLTPAGNLTLVDDIGTTTEEGQQFITLVTKDGNYFYLIIDRDDDGNENVHFLNLVDEQDLFALLDEEEQEAYEADIAGETEEVTEEPVETEPAETDTETPDKETSEVTTKKKATNTLPLLLTVVLVAGAGGGYFYLQTRKKKKAEKKPDPDADYMEEEEVYELPEEEEDELTTNSSNDED